MGSGARRAGRAGHRGRGVGHRHPLDLLPVLCIARDLRWGRVNETFGEDPFLIGELALGDGARLSGRRARRPDGDPRHREALRRLLRDAGRARRERGGHLAPEAPLLVPPAVRAGRTRGMPHLHARLPVHRRRADHRQRLAAERGAARRVGLHRHPHHRLGQRRPDGVGAARPARLRARRGGGRQGRQRHGDDDARILPGRARRDRSRASSPRTPSTRRSRASCC